MSVVKRTVKRTSIVSGGGGGDEGFESSSTSSSSFRSSSSSSSSSGGAFHQVYRGMSPSSATRLENRVKELEEALEQERNAHIRTEKELNELRFSFDSLRERLEESENETSVQLEINRRKDQDFLKIKKELETVTSQYEVTETSLKKRHQELLNDLTDQLEKANKNRSKIEKERQQLTIEIESYISQADAASKGKAYSDSKLEALEEQIRKLKFQVDELTKTNQELQSIKLRLTQENEDYQRQLHELESNVGSSSKLKIQITQQLDEAKAKFEEESRIRLQLEMQVNGLLDDVANLRAQLSEEADAAASFKTQAAKSQTEFQQLKIKYDKDVGSVTEQLEEIDRKSVV